MPVLDTSVLVAFFNADDPYHKRSRKTLSALKDALVPSEVLVELLLVLGHRVRKAENSAAARRVVRDVHRAIDDSAVMDVVPTPHIEQAGRLFQEDPQLSLVDSIAIVQALGTGEDLLTFDRKQARVFEKKRTK